MLPQPIETAPKDRIIRLMNSKHGVQYIAKWNQERGFWQGTYYGITASSATYWDPDDEIQPTHWEEIK